MSATQTARRINAALTQAAEGREGARKFHRSYFGHGVDPQHCFADFLLCVSRAKGKSPTESITAKRRLEGVYKATMLETSGTTGGYLVPPELRDDLMDDVADGAAVRPRATVVKMDSRTLLLPVLDATTAPSASGVAPFWGGMQLQFIPEGLTRLETEPKYRQLSLTAADLGGYALCSRPLMQDGVNLESWLRHTFARSLAWYEDWYFINGQGAGQPVGIINAGCKVTTTRNTTSHFKINDAQNMMASLYAAGEEPVWLMTRAAGTDLVSFTGWIPNGPLILYGSEILVTLKQPALGTAGDVIYADLSFYVIGDRGEVLIDVSHDEPTAFKNNQDAWRIVERVDGQPMLNAPITIPDGGTSTVSPFVVLT